MTEEIQKTLLIKTVFGRVLLDSNKLGLQFRLEPVNTGWQITIHCVDKTLAFEIQTLIRDLNLFYFEQHIGEELPRKWWLYDKTVPSYKFEMLDQATGQLTLTVDSRARYSNEKV